MNLRFCECRDERLRKLSVGDERDVHIYRLATDQKAVLAFFERPRLDIDEEVEVTRAEKLEDIGGAFLMHFVHGFHTEAVRVEELRCVLCTEKLESHLREFADG